LLSTLSIRNSNIIADKSYGSAKILNWIKAQGAKCVIPPKENTKKTWKIDWHLYKERHLVECFFNTIKRFKRVATRYDKLASSFLAFVTYQLFSSRFIR